MNVNHPSHERALKYSNRTHVVQHASKLWKWVNMPQKQWQAEKARKVVPTYLWGVVNLPEKALTITAAFEPSRAGERSTVLLVF